MFKLSLQFYPAAAARTLTLTRTKVPHIGLLHLQNRALHNSAAMKSEQDNRTDGGHPNETEPWRNRPPYRTHAEGGFPVKYEADCHCGRVKYQLSREVPLGSKFCHCSTCQKQHSAPFQWAAIFHKDDINFLSGDRWLEWYNPSAKEAGYNLPCKVRCSYCHSPVMDEGRNMVLLFPSLIKMKNQKERDNFKPHCHMFYAQRHVDIPDGLPKWSGMEKESDLIEDSPKEMMEQQKREKEGQKQEEEGNENKKRKMEE
jgi:hypothetical protein